MSNTPTVDESIDYPPTPNIGEQPTHFALSPLFTIDLSDRLGHYQQFRVWISTTGKKTLYVGTDNGGQHKRPFTYHKSKAELTTVPTLLDFFRLLDKWHSKYAHYYQNKTTDLAACKSQAMTNWFV